MSTSLEIRSFAQLGKVTIPLGDLTLLVGPQATGKSLALQLLKLSLDRARIVGALQRQSFQWSKGRELLDLYFGEGMASAWRSSTKVSVGARNLTLAQLEATRGRTEEHSVFYVPAHRTLSVSGGWPRSFREYPLDTPFVVRQFSEQVLSEVLTKKWASSDAVFPQGKRFKEEVRDYIDRAIFHGGTLDLKGERQRSLRLSYEGTELSYMAWTAGQREFIPLMLGLYYLLPAGQTTRRKAIQWVVIEEPEMGLHPKGILAVMLAVLELLARGYKVALSTHSPLVVEVAWALRMIQGSKRRQREGAILELFDLGGPSPRLLGSMRAVLEKEISAVSLDYGDDGKVSSLDISTLDPGSAQTREAGWGGLTGLGSELARTVGKWRE